METFSFLIEVLMAVRSIPGIATALMLGASLIPAQAAENLHGAGATFPAPLYARWAEAYNQAQGVAVDYDAVGSGAGIDMIRKGEIDFGASDDPLPPEALAASGLLQFPVVIGGVVPVINIRGIKAGELKLSGPVLAGIYLGKIRKWNEKPIAELNPALQLPDVYITVVHRSDSSGSSMLWTKYLSQVSPAWRAQVGASLTPSWPAGVSSAGNEGVASYVQHTHFSIGYVEFAYARSHKLSDVSLRNHDGRYVRAGLETFRAAAQAGNWGAMAATQQLGADLPGPSSWPITGASFILISTAPASSARALGVMKFFDWALHHGESIARDLDYEPIPRSVLDQLPGLWRQGIRDGNGRPVW